MRIRFLLRMIIIWIRIATRGAGIIAKGLHLLGDFALDHG